MIFAEVFVIAKYILLIIPSRQDMIDKLFLGAILAVLGMDYNLYESWNSCQ